MHSHEALSVSSQGALEISSVTGQPPSLDRCHFCTPRLVVESCKCDESLRPSSQRPQYPTLYRRLKRRLGHSLRSEFNKGSVVRSGKKAPYKRPRIEGCLTGPSKVQNKPNSSSCNGQLNSGSLQRTKDLRGSRSLLFISFKKGHTSDIRPTTLSSWLKQTILLCYKQADEQALDLVQVKANDIRAFAASKAFYGGLSVDQIMQAYHWKAHNTFTNFYLKDLTWSDNDNNMYLGPEVAAQHVLDPSPQNSNPRKEKKGVGWGTSTTTKS